MQMQQEQNVWQWYVNKGSGFIVVTDDANFSGSKTKTLTITNALSSFNNWIFREKQPEYAVHLSLRTSED